MRSDAKLGMALGMLVVGFAIAFCFPREGRVSIVEQVVRKQSIPETDEIEFVPIRELRDGSEADEIFPEDMTESPVEESETQLSPAIGQSEPEDQSSQPDASLSLKNLLPDSEVLPESEISEEHPATNKKLDESEKTYVVQQGDTLSGISLKTLGSYGRYLDIYEANRDQLESPDDLKLGMQLKIPFTPADSQAQESSVADVVEVLPENLTTNSNGTQTKPSKRFSSTQRTPFLTDRRPEMPVHQIPARQATTHTVQQGDTLERIAVRYFGTVKAIRQIHQANPELIRNSRSLQPGMVLKLIP